MVVDLKKLDAEKETWQFATVVYWQGVEWKVKGWRYWPESKTVKPPSYEAYKKRLPLVEFAGSQEQLLVEVDKALAGLQGSTRVDDSQLFALYLELNKFEDPEVIFAFRRKYPQLSREFFIRSVDEELRPLFDSLPEGRLWPDEYLKGKAEQIVNKKPHEPGWTAAIASEHLDLGIFSEADFKRIYEFVGGKK